jgi:hypothetical protein
MNEFISYAGSTHYCGGSGNFDKYNHLILFPLNDASRNIKLPFPATGMMYFEVSQGAYYYCIGF